MAQALPSGDVVLGGSLLASVDFGDPGDPVVHANNGGRDAFVASWSMEGSLKWAVSFGDSGDELVTAVAPAPNGDLVACGDFEGGFELAGTPHVAESRDFFVVRLNGATGDVVWSKSFGGTGYDQCMAVAVDEAGNAIIGGLFNGSLTIGNNTYDSVFDSGFVARLDETGIPLWSTTLANARVPDLAVDQNGDVVVGGWYNGTIAIPGCSAENGLNDLYVAKLGVADGSCQWSRSFGDTSWQLGRALDVDESGGIYLVGEFEGQIAFGGTTLPLVNSTSIDQVRSLPAPDPAAAVTGAWQPDGALELRLSDGSTEIFFVELRSSHLGADTARQLRFAESSAAARWLLPAPYVGAPLGAALQQQGINFIDRQGNCHLRIGTRHVARIQGRTAPKGPARGRALRAPAYQVMFALLAEQDLLSAPQRAIAAAAGTSRPPVATLLSRWTEEGIVVRRQGRHRWVEGPDRTLLDAFLAGYRATLRPSLEVGRFRLPVRTPPDVEAWLEERLAGVRYGGTAGGYRLERHYRGPLTVAHLGPPSEETRRLLKASPTRDGELVWMRHVGEVSLRGETPDTVHPLLIYSELMSERDPRAGEAADRVRERWLPWSL